MPKEIPLGEPDPFRLRYRNAIMEIVSHIVKSQMDKKAAIHSIRIHSAKLPTQDQAVFIETVERELMALHEGNIARYKLRPMNMKSGKNIGKDIRFNLR